MTVFDLKIDPNGRFYVPASVREKIPSGAMGVSVNSVILLLNKDMDREMVLECVRLMLDELDLEQRIRQAEKLAPSQNGTQTTL